MADEDDVDILGDFSLNSFICGTDRDIVNKLNTDDNNEHECCVHSVQQTSPGQMQSLLSSGEMEVRHGIHLNFTAGLEEGIVEDCEGNVPNFIQEEILIDTDVPDTIQGMMSLVNTGQPTVSAITVYSSKGTTRKVFKNNSNTVTKSKLSLLKPDVLSNISRTKTSALDIGRADEEVLYCGDDFVIGSTESVGGTDDSLDDEDILHTARSHLVLPKLGKKSGNHRRKYTTSGSSGGSKAGKPQTKFNISLSIKNKRREKKPKEVGVRSKGWRGEAGGGEASLSPKLELVFSSGQAVPVCEGEQVIKIEKKKRADSESDVEIDIDSEAEDNDATTRTNVLTTQQNIENTKFEARTTVQRKFEPMRPRQKKVNLDGDGGCTIMHTESGDLIEVVPEPRKERMPRKQPIQLFHCKHFSTEKPAPYSVRLLVSALVQMEAHAHGSRAEVMGLLGGELRAGVLHLRAYTPCAAAADHTHCDMCPVSQARAAEALNESGHSVVGWHHSHPRFAAQPSELDLRTQRSLQDALERHLAPFLALITSQHWQRGRTASHYRCLRVEREGVERRDTGYQFSVKLIPDLTAASVPEFLARLQDVRRAHADDAYRVNMAADVCPDAAVTYLDKCLSSVSHHLTSAGYSEQDLTFKQVIKGIRDIFR